MITLHRIQGIYITKTIQQVVMLQFPLWDNRKIKDHKFWSSGLHTIFIEKWLSGHHLIIPIAKNITTYINTSTRNKLVDNNSIKGYTLICLEKHTAIALFAYSTLYPLEKFSRRHLLASSSLPIKLLHACTQKIDQYSRWSSKLIQSTWYKGTHRVFSQALGPAPLSISSVSQ